METSDEDILCHSENIGKKKMKQYSHYKGYFIYDWLNLPRLCPSDVALFPNLSDTVDLAV